MKKIQKTDSNRKDGIRFFVNELFVGAKLPVFALQFHKMLHKRSSENRNPLPYSLQERFSQHRSHGNIPVQILPSVQLRLRNPVFLDLKHMVAVLNGSQSVRNDNHRLIAAQALD